jgi:hypothetical protein
MILDISCAPSEVRDQKRLRNKSLRQAAHANAEILDYGHDRPKGPDAPVPYSHSREAAMMQATPSQKNGSHV